jgi:hypothetical protein
VKSLGPAAIFCGVLTVLLSLPGCNTHPVSAASPLSQSQAEKLAAQITINSCNADRTNLKQSVKLGTPDPNGHIREKYGPVLVYPIQVTWTGSCVGKVMGRTDYYENINAKYTASYYQDDFGEWKHTPYVGKCDWSRTAYQMEGEAKASIPNPPVDGCALMDLSAQ